MATKKSTQQADLDPQFEFENKIGQAKAIADLIGCQSPSMVHADGTLYHASVAIHDLLTEAESLGYAMLEKAKVNSGKVAV